MSGAGADAHAYDTRHWQTALTLQIALGFMGAGAQRPSSSRTISVRVSVAHTDSFSRTNRLPVLGVPDGSFGDDGDVRAVVYFGQWSHRDSQPHLAVLRTRIRSALRVGDRHWHPSLYPKSERTAPQFRGQWQRMSDSRTGPRASYSTNARAETIQGKKQETSQGKER